MSAKPKRHEDKELIEVIQCLPCYACVEKSPQEARNSIGAGQKQSDAHHIKTRGSGGGDFVFNLMPLCRKHHREIHQIQTFEMSQKYKMIESWLILAGWKLEEKTNRWTHEDNHAL